MHLVCIKKERSDMVRVKFITLTVIILLFCSTSLSFAAVDGAVTIKSPKNNSSTASNNILISVEVTEPKTIRISLYEEMQLVHDKYISIDINKELEKKAIEENNSKKVNTISALKTESILTEMEPAYFTTVNSLTYCTKQVNGLTPGLYKIKVDTLNGAGETIFTRENHFGIMSKELIETDTLENEKSGPVQIFQNILKFIVGS